MAKKQAARVPAVQTQKVQPTAPSPEQVAQRPKTAGEIAREAKLIHVNLTSGGRNGVLQAEAISVEINAPGTAQLAIAPNGRTLWVNVDGVCVLRLNNMTTLELDDQRS